MKIPKKPSNHTRREFLKQIGSAGLLMCLETGKLLPTDQNKAAAPLEAEPDCKFSTVSVKHIPKLKTWMDKLDKAGRLTTNRTWRKYINSFQYSPPQSLPKAQSLIIMATPLKIAVITFHMDGKKHIVMIPAGYVDDGMTLADYHKLVYKNQIVSNGQKLELAKLPLKQLAVRSGLAEYGKNNITFIDGYGSYHQLLAFYSEQRLEDHWDRLKMLHLCKGCSICLKECPNRAIRENDFIINHEKCITLYNELPDPMPEWIPASAHNALVGCLKCQYNCPGNEDMKNDLWNLGEVTEAETNALLSGKIGSETERSLQTKLKHIGGGDNLPYIARNLKLILNARSSK